MMMCSKRLPACLLYRMMMCSKRLPACLPAVPDDDVF
jgi:hypothetical protein